MRERRGAAVWRVGGQVLYVFYFPSLLIMFIIFFFLSCQLRSGPGPRAGSTVNIPQGPYGNLNHSTQSNQDLLNPVVPSAKEMALL